MFDTGEKLNYKPIQSRFKYALHRPKKNKTKKNVWTLSYDH